MQVNIQIKPSDLLAMDPMDLAEYLKTQVVFEMPIDVDTPENKRKAVETLSQATAYICYFREMEMFAKYSKRKAKRNKCSPEEADRLIGVEEVFEMYKRIAEQYYDSCSKLMTMKRLQIDETRYMGSQT